MKSLKLLGKAVLDTVKGLLTFNLPMSRVPQVKGSAAFVAAVMLLTGVLDALDGGVYSPLFFGLIALVIWNERPRTLPAADAAGEPVVIDPAAPSRSIAMGYVVGIVNIIATVIHGLLLATFGEGLARLLDVPVYIWVVLVLLVMIQRIERHQIALIAAYRQTDQLVSSASSPSSSSESDPRAEAAEQNLP